MTRLLLGGLSAMVLTTVAAPMVKAQEISTTNLVPSTQAVYQISPVNLVEWGYRGYLQNQGVNSYGQFIADTNSGKLTAQELIKAGVADGRLSPNTIQDHQYVSTVAGLLRDTAPVEYDH